MLKYIFMIIAILLIPAILIASDYVIEPSSITDTVFFRSSAKLEFIEGQSTDVVGYFDVDPSTKDSKVSGRIRVDLRTLRTGIETRDEHMRDNHLHTDKYPYAYFDLESLSKRPSEFLIDSTYNFEAKGKFYIHNGFRPLTATITTTRKIDKTSTEYFDVRVNFNINLDDFKIKRPKALFLKLAETMELEVIFRAYNNLEKSEVALPGWSEIR